MSELEMMFKYCLEHHVKCWGETERRRTLTLLSIGEEGRQGERLAKLKLDAARVCFFLPRLTFCLSEF